MKTAPHTGKALPRGIVYLPSLGRYRVSIQYRQQTFTRDFVGLASALDYLRNQRRKTFAEELATLDEMWEAEMDLQLERDRR